MGSYDDKKKKAQEIVARISPKADISEYSESQLDDVIATDVKRQAQQKEPVKVEAAPKEEGFLEAVKNRTVEGFQPMEKRAETNIELQRKARLKELSDRLRATALKKQQP